MIDTVITARRVSGTMSILAIRGMVTAEAEQALMDAYAEACGPETEAVILDFEHLEYMNSTGIGLLVTLLIRAQRRRQRLFACGLTEHYRRILELTRIDEAIEITACEEDAIAAATAAA